MAFRQTVLRRRRKANTGGRPSCRSLPLHSSERSKQGEWGGAVTVILDQSGFAARANLVAIERSGSHGLGLLCSCVRPRCTNGFSYRRCVPTHSGMGRSCWAFLSVPASRPCLVVARSSGSLSARLAVYTPSWQRFITVAVGKRERQTSPWGAFKGAPLADQRDLRCARARPNKTLFASSSTPLFLPPNSNADGNGRPRRRRAPCSSAIKAPPPLLWVCGRVLR